MKRHLLLYIIMIFSTNWALGSEVIPFTDSVYVTAQQKPIFPGCDAKASLPDIEVCSQGNLLQWVFKNLEYPRAAREANIQGVAVMSFVINQDGSIDDIKTVKDPGGGLGDEGVRILQMMKTEIVWQPAMNDDEAVRFRYVLPIKFRLGAPTQDMFLVFKAWGGQEVFRGMVNVDVQDAIPDMMIKNVETYDYQKSKAVYKVFGNVHIVHFRPKKLARPQELESLKPKKLSQLDLNDVNIRYVKDIDQLNITLPKVKQSLKYYVHNYIGDVIHQGSISRTNGHIEKIDVSKAAKGVLFVSFATKNEYATALGIKQ